MTIKLTPLTAGTTLGALKTMMANFFDDLSSGFATRVAAVANLIYRDFAARGWPWLHGSSTITTQSGLAEYPLDNSAAGISVGRMWIDGQGFLERKTLHELRGWQGSDSATGQPCYFAMLTKTLLVLWPTPDSAYSIGYDYEVNVGDLVNDDEQPAIPAADQWVWIAGVMAQLMQLDNRFDAASQIAQARYDSGILALKARDIAGVDARSKVLGTPAV